jgi:hypothetical protein
MKKRKHQAMLNALGIGDRDCCTVSTTAYAFDIVLRSLQQ